MVIVMGASGHVGGAVARALLDRGEAVTVLTRRPTQADGWRERGATVLEADAADAESLARAFRTGRRAFLLNPPADPAGDVDATERRTVATILTALAGSGLEKVVAASTYGARPGEGMGDLTSLGGLEEELRRQPIPAAINRGAYYMTNWTALADQVRRSGSLPSFFPPDATMPMVAPDDLGRAAAERLLSPVEDIGVRHVEGPARYTPRAVADAFAAALGRPMDVAVTPRADWVGAYRRLGFSEASARSFASMTGASLDEQFGKPADFERGRVTLRAFIDAAVA